MGERREYELTVGQDAAFWLDQLRAPGGGALVGPVRVEGPTWLFPYAAVQVGARARWRKAQAAEAAFWRGWRRNELYKDVEPGQFWAEFLAKTGGQLPSGKVLDIGCGPVSLLNYHRAEGLQPIGIDPLAVFYAREKLTEQKQGWQPIPMIALPAEQLPFADASLDHAVCCNVLDHVSDAPTVLREIHRVLKPGGSVRVYVHSFETWIKRLLFFDRPHVYHWDHAEFRSLLEANGFAVTCELHEPKSFDIPPGFWNWLRYFPFWVAAKVCYTSYFALQKRES